jgi:hypothetical protein
MIDFFFKFIELLIMFTGNFLYSDKIAGCREHPKNIEESAKRCGQIFKERLT